MTDRERLLDELRPVSFAIAYRMLGSVSEAEDIVQEALLRVHRGLEDGDRIQSPSAFVATVTTRLAIDELRSARMRREEYVGEWLPEPIVTDGGDDPVQHAEMADLLAHDVVLTGDGGGKAPALARSLRGRNRVARKLMGYWTKWAKLSARSPRAHLRATEINGSPGALALDGGERVIGVVVLDIDGDQIQGISSIANPDKLAHLGPTTNLGSLL